MIRPLRDRVLVRRMAEDEKTAGGLFIPDTAKEKPQKGEVIAAGNGHITEKGETLPLDVKVGDKVIFTKYAGTEVQVDGENYLMMREIDIVAVFE